MTTSLETKLADAQAEVEAAQARVADAEAELALAEVHLDAVEQTIAQGAGIQAAWPTAERQFRMAYGCKPDLYDPTDTSAFMQLLEAEVSKRRDRTMSERANALIEKWTRIAKETPHEF